MLRFLDDGTLDPREIRVFKTEVEYEDVFDLKQLYKELHEWLGQWGFTADPDVQKDTDLNFKEVLYWERTDQSGTAFHHCWWRVVKPGTKYHRVFFRINFQTLGFNKQEFMYNNQKKKADKGDLIIRLEAWVQLDYANKWAKGPLLKKLDRILQKKLQKPDIQQLRDDTLKLAYHFQQYIKEYLELRQPYPQGASFHPQKGYKYT
jgi:hypothetical protein